MRMTVTGDLSSLPENTFGLRSIIWWGLMGFMAIETMAFVLGAGAYLYVRNINTEWPLSPDDAPGLLAGVITTLLLVFSEVANRWLARRAKAMDERAVLIGLAVMVAFGLAATASRFFEFPALNTRWDENAYGSVVWLMLLLHTVHLLTDLIDTIVFMIWCWTHQMDAQQFSETYDNCGYWTFVVVSWLPIWALIYFAPRVM
jgi:cytochrome c oxidase subunit III